MTTLPRSQGFSPVLSNRYFQRLWAAQWLSQTSQNTINFILIVLIERLTGSSIQLGLMILSFTLPGVIFAPISGIIIDRWSKRRVLVASNALRVLMVINYLLLIEIFSTHYNGWVLFALYATAFIMATIAQFFNPAEAATIPFLVERNHLMAANSLFNLTLALSQVFGLIIFGPLAVKLIGIEAAFVMVAVGYALAALLVSRLPADQPNASHQAFYNSRQRAQTEFREGIDFVARDRIVLTSMMHLTLIASLVMVLAMLAPGISSRVFHLAPEDAIIVFAPAGIGMLLAAVVLGRWGARFPKPRLVRLGLALMTLSYLLFGIIAWRFQVTNQPLILGTAIIHLPPASAALILTTVGLSLLLGLTMSSVNIVSQTLLQERTPEQLRGRVFSVQFMLNNLVGIPPMLAIGALADWIGIPPMLVGISALVLIVLLLTLRLEARLQAEAGYAESFSAPATGVEPPVESPPDSDPL